ncbi:cation:proton antiporter [Streptomyces solincola]|uniref:hypothetical protein n=1 Tax=Streptomyces solincola TaxID=2100817 RepID=UPI0026990C7C|nr:hypothetical protein [Streptomyces solincola]
MLLGGRTHRFTNARIRLQLHAVNGTVLFLLESVVFSLIGLTLAGQVAALGAADRLWPLYALAVAATLVAVRMLLVLPLSAVLYRSAGERTFWRLPAVLTWAGTRGVVPLAAALSIPVTTDGGGLLQQRPLFLVLTTSVVVVTLVAQGFTLEGVVRRSGIALEPDHTEREEAEARCSLAAAGIRRLDDMADLEAVPTIVADRARRGFQARLDDARERLGEGDLGPSEDHAYRSLRRDLIRAGAAELRRLYVTHRISDATRRRLQRSLDLEEARLELARRPPRANAGAATAGWTPPGRPVPRPERTWHPARTPDRRTAPVGRGAPHGPPRWATVPFVGRAKLPGSVTAVDHGVRPPCAVG